MGFLNLLRGGVDTVTRAKSAGQQAEMQNLPLLAQLQQMAHQREQQQQEYTLKARLTDAQIRNYDSEAKHRGEVPDAYDTVPTVDGMYNHNKRTGDLSRLSDPDTHEPLVPFHPETPAPNNVYLPSVDPETGKTVYTLVPGKGPVDPQNTHILKPDTSGGGSALDHARLETAKNQATEADKVMRAYEDKLLSGEAQIGSAASAAAKLALRGGALTSTAAETALSSQDPDLWNYIRAAKQLATAERLITPRGGSNYLMAAEAMLSAAGPHAHDSQIEQARKYREALIGGVQGHGTTQSGAPVTHPPPHASEPTGGKTVTVNGKTFRLPE